MLNDNLDEALELARKQLVRFQGEGDKDNIINFFIEVARLCRLKEDFKDAEYNATQALKLLQESDNNILLAKVYMELGDIYRKSLDMGTAEKSYEKSLEITSVEEDQGKLLLNLAAINLEQLDYEKALDYGKKGIQVFERLKDVNSLVNTYKIVTKTYTRTKQREKALESVNQMFKSTGIEKEKEYEIARVYHSLKDYDSALKHFLKADELGLDDALSANVNSFIGRIYLKKSKPKPAYKHLDKAYRNRDLLKGLEFRFVFANMGTYYHLLNDLDNARKFYNEALNLFVADGSLAYINFFFNEIQRIDNQLAFEFAIKNPFGIVWLLEIVKQKEFQSTDPRFWKLLTSASRSWWKYYKDKENYSLFQHWKIKQMNQNITSKITSETILNFLLGANNLSTADLHDEEEGLSPRWFIELPVEINHGEKYLKIRLNNLVQHDQQFLGYPHNIDKNEYTFSPVDRIVFSLRTQWLQEITYDHVFIPNTQSEWDSSRKNNELVWLKDCFAMDLGDHSTSVDQLELTCQVSIYFNQNNEDPDVKTTNRHFVIPILRKNRYQILQKYKKNNENALTVLIASSSLLSSLYLFITSPTFFEIQSNIQNLIPPSYLPLLLGLSGALLIIITMLSAYFLRKPLRTPPME